MTEPVLELRAVRKSFAAGGSEVRAVQDVSLAVAAGGCLAVVGESGSGKSTIANMILGIYPPDGGEIRFEGAPLPARRGLELRRAIQLVQQNPLSSLNPKRSVGASLRLALDVHRIGARRERPALAAALLEEVGLPAHMLARAPAELSGGQCQRIAIARALACDSRLLVLDEPTSALDVLVQAQVLRLLLDLRARRAMTYVFITHDLGVVRNIADQVAVIERGRLVEMNRTEQIFTRPGHAYTRKLFASIPAISDAEQELKDRLLAQAAAA